MHVRANSTVLQWEHGLWYLKAHTHSEGTDISVANSTNLFSTFAIPKSPSFTIPFFVKNMFCKSRMRKNATWKRIQTRTHIAVRVRGLISKKVHLRFDVSVKNFPVMDVLYRQTNLHKPVQYLSATRKENTKKWNLLGRHICTQQKKGTSDPKHLVFLKRNASLSIDPSVQVTCEREPVCINTIRNHPKDIAQTDDRQCTFFLFLLPPSQ